LPDEILASHSIRGASRGGRRSLRRSVRRTHFWIIVALSALAMVIVAGGAETASASAPSIQLHVQLSQDGPHTLSGEPEIAVDPANPNKLFGDWATFQNPLVINGPSIPRSCGGAVSTDGGAHWHQIAVPINNIPHVLGCEDGVAVAGPDGTLYASGDFATYTGFSTGGISVGGQSVVVHGQDFVTHSTNWGKTWSAPVETMGSDGQRFVAGKGGLSVDTFDRPWLAVDQSTGTVYAIGHNLTDHGGFVTASTNHAHTFGPIYAVDSSTYPHDPQTFGGNIAVSRGMMATAYSASRAPGATCPCMIFETSTDHGATFARHVVPLVNAAAAPEPFIAADPTAKGHFALTVFDSTGTENEVYVTNDAGQTWQGPTLVGETPPNQRFKPWIAYGPTGVLALVWRTQYANQSNDVWAAISRQTSSNGAVFSAPLRVSSAPPAPYPHGYFAGDDFSWIITDRNYVHVGWGDSGSGTVQAWYARIPLTTFGSG
jgi:hypothetical protein